MIGDDELLAATLTGPPSALRVALAFRVLARAGTEPKLAELAAATGYAKSALYDARHWLDKELPGWRDLPPERNPVDVAESYVSATAENPWSEAPPLELVLEQVADALVEAETDAVLEHLGAAGPAPAWRQAVEEGFGAVIGRRSWNLYDDVYLGAWERTCDLVHVDADPSGDCIALAIHMVETIEGAAVEGRERGLIAKLVRQYGKVALYGLNRALGVTDDDTPRDRFRYARAICERIVVDLRAREAEEAEG